MQSLHTRSVETFPTLTQLGTTELVEVSGIEPLASWLQTRRSPS
jgi:hypothetical protein